MKLTNAEANFILEQLQWGLVTYLREEKEHQFCDKIDGYRENVYEPTKKLYNTVIAKLQKERDRVVSPAEREWKDKK
jgi:hypothetical protein